MQYSTHSDVVTKVVENWQREIVLQEVGKLGRYVSGSYYGITVTRQLCVQDDPALINELREDVHSECTKFGEVRKVQVYDVS